jgi:hypothetical protein
MTSRGLLLGVLLVMIGCGGSTPPPAAAAEAPAPKTADAGASLTAEECQAAGGHVVGDIGNGAIHRPGYRCPGSGEPPLGKITPPPGGPIPIEGSVCCR